VPNGAEKGMSRAGNARVRAAWSNWPGVGSGSKGQPIDAVVQQQDRKSRGDIRKTMIVALARKLLVSLWRM